MNGPRVEIIEGQQTLVVERRPPLQPKLDALLSSLYHVRYAQNITPKGATLACEVDREHRFDVLRIGRHTGLDGVIRDLKILMCVFCGAAQVRDIGLDVTIAGEPVPRSGAPKRRDMVIGWYTGKRMSGRAYL